MDQPTPTPPLVPTPMPSRSFFQAHKTAILGVVLVLVVSFGVLWWQSGFTLDFSRFFAATPVTFTLNANPTTTAPGGGTVVFSWAPGTASCTGSGLSFSGQSLNVTQTTTFTVNCTFQIPNGGQASTGSASVTVTVPPAPTNPPAPVVTPNLDICRDNIAKIGTIVIGTTTATAQVRNDSHVSCAISLASYQIWSDRGGDPGSPPVYQSTQTFFAENLKTVPAGGTATLTVNLPPCFTQIDLAIGAAPRPQPTYNSHDFLGVQFANANQYCNNPTPTPTPPPTTPPPPPLVCSPLTQSALLNQSRTVTASGGTGTYSWFMPGGTPATGAGTSIAVSYATSGNKIVTLTSGGNQVTCAITVTTPPPTTITPPPTTITPPPTTITPPPTTITPPPSTITPPPTTITPPPLTPALTIQKTVRNLTQNGNEADSISANPSDTVEFIVRVSSVGSADAQNVIIRDALPAGLTYQAGTTTIDTITGSDGIVSTGLNLGTLSPGRTVTVRFRALVAPDTFFGVGSTVLVNTAYVRATNLPEISDSAFVNVLRSPSSPTMTLTKMGRNLTRGQISGEFSPVTASPGDTVEFVIHIRNTSLTAITNVIVNDILPQGVTYLAGTARLNGVAAADTLVLSGTNIGTIGVGQEALITFSGRISPGSSFPVGTTTLINTAQARADSVAQLIAQLPIIITNAIVTPPNVSTGPGESTALALIVSAIVTLLYVGYTSTDLYRRREATGLAHEAEREKDLFNFRK